MSRRVSPSTARVRAALHHQESDKAPIDMGGFQTGIHVVAYTRLLEHLGIEDRGITFYDWVQQLAIPCDEVLERLHVDTCTVHLPSTFMTEKQGEAMEVTEGDYIGFWDKFGIFWGRSGKQPSPRLLYTPVIHPLADCTTVRQVKEHAWPDGSDKAPFKGLREHALMLRGAGTRALIGRSMGCLFQWTHYLFGFAKAMRHAFKRPDLMQAAMECLLEYYTGFARQYLDTVGDLVETVQVTSDLTDQQGPLLNPVLYRNVIKPVEAEFARRLHSMADVKVNYHCCGAAWHFIDDFIEIGYDALNPVQVSAEGMNPAGLKASYGDRIVFWGGACNPQATLPFGTPADVRAETIRNVTALKAGGGYIAASIHNITYDVPPANVVAMFDAIEESRSYP